MIIISHDMIIMECIYFIYIYTQLYKVPARWRTNMENSYVFPAYADLSKKQLRT